MKTRKARLISLGIALAYLMLTVPSFASVPSNTDPPLKQATDPCLQRRPLTMVEQEKLSFLYVRLLALDPLRPRSPLADDSAYQRALKKILHETRPDSHSEISLNTQTTIEKGLILVLYDEFKNLVSRSVGLDSREFFKFNMIFTDNLHFSGMNKAPMREVAENLKKSINRFYDRQSPLSRATPRELNQMSEDDFTALDQFMKENQIWDQRRQQTLTAIDRIEHIGEDIADENEALLNDRLHFYARSIEATAALTVAVGSLWAAGPIVAAGSAAAGTVGTILGGCAIGAGGGTAVAALEQSLNAFGKAYLLSSSMGTSLSCELRRELAMSNKGTSDGSESLEGLTTGFVGGLASGCTVVGASIVVPKTVAAAVVGSATFSTGYEGYQTYKSLRESAQSSRLSTQEMRHQSTIDPGQEVVPLETILNTSQDPSDTAQTVDAYAFYQSLRAYQMALEAARKQNETEAMQHLNDARAFAVEAGHHALEAAITGMLFHGFHKDLLPALSEGRLKIIEAISTATDDLPTALKVIAHLVLGSHSDQAGKR